jgi:magnesium chelatase accessory protein
MSFAAGALQWDRDGADWPNRAHSRFVRAAGIRWHVQCAGVGPCLLLLHGTGAATHSWRDLLPLLATRFTVVAPDLPGHGFTAALSRPRMTLPGIAAAVAALLEALEERPALVVGHSAGAAILARCCLDRCFEPAALVALNGALLPLRGLSTVLFAPAARLLASSSLASGLFARQAALPGAVERLIDGTGSRIDARGIEFYRRVVSNRAHVAAVLTMMAQWDLEPLRRELPELATPLHLVVGEHDRTVPPAEALRVQALQPRAVVHRLAGLGHLAHEESPECVMRLLCAIGGREGPQVADRG